MESDDAREEATQIVRQLALSAQQVARKELKGGFDAVLARLAMRDVPAARPVAFAEESQPQPAQGKNPAP